MHNVETKFRIPLGQKQFKLTCPIILTSDKDNTMIQWSKNGEQVREKRRYSETKFDINLSAVHALHPVR